MDNAASAALPPLPTEQVLIDAWPVVANSLGSVAPGSRRALVISPGRAQFARLLQGAGTYAAQAWYLDLHQASEATHPEDDLEVLCGADLPQAEYDLVAMPLLKKSEAELSRDLMQQAYERLVGGGILLVSVDNPRDSWLHNQMQALFDKVSCERTKKGCVYWGRQKGPLKKKKSFGCEFAFRDEEQLIHVLSRPGVFSHRRLDPGARQLMLAAEIGPTDNVLDMGCGTGAVALAAAHKTSGQVYGVDSNARFVECLKEGAKLTRLENVVPVWNADGALDLPTQIDLALANPPYFGDHAISQHFVDSAVEQLRPGGALLVVTKQPNWYEAYFQEIQLEDIVIFEASRYFVACGRKPALL